MTHPVWCQADHVILNPDDQPEAVIHRALIGEAARGDRDSCTSCSLYDQADPVTEIELRQDDQLIALPADAADIRALGELLIRACRPRNQLSEPWQAF